jgi:hypothetical protein
MKKVHAFKGRIKQEHAVEHLFMKGLLFTRITIKAYLILIKQHLFLGTL